MWCISVICKSYLWVTMLGTAKPEAESMPEQVMLCTIQSYKAYPSRTSCIQYRSSDRCQLGFNIEGAQGALRSLVICQLHQKLNCTSCTKNQLSDPCQATCKCSNTKINTTEIIHGSRSKLLLLTPCSVHVAAQVLAQRSPASGC